MFFLRSQMSMLLKLVSCWVSRGAGEKNREWRPLFLSRKCTLSCTPAARASVSSHVPLARDSRWRACSHTTYLPSWNLSRCSLSHNHVISHTLVVACEPCDITRVPYCHKIMISHTNWKLDPTWLNPFGPRDFAKKRVLKLYDKAVYRSYCSWPSDPDAK